VSYTVVSTDGTIITTDTRYRARGAARRLSVGCKAVIVSEGKLVACASNGRILPAKWVQKWTGETRREWARIAEGAT
jgi:hypothetical protein